METQEPNLPEEQWELIPNIKNASCNQCKILSCIRKSHKKQCWKLSRYNSHPTPETLKLLNFPETTASHQALSRRLLLPSTTSTKQKPFPFARKMPLIPEHRHHWKYFCRILWAQTTMYYFLVVIFYIIQGILKLAFSPVLWGCFHELSKWSNKH